MALTPYDQLEQEFRRLHAFRGALSLLRWDAAVMMPRGSADVRGEQLAALETEHHALLTTPKVARLLERAEAGASQLEDWPLANLREMRRQRDHAIATPPSLIARLAKATSRAEFFWVEARKANDFKLFAPHLEEVVTLVRDKAALLECRLLTGRTHQIRVHLAERGHPLIGDPVYGGRAGRSLGRSGTKGVAVPYFPRQALHARHLGFIHPVSGETLAFDSALPADMAALLSTLERL